MEDACVMPGRSLSELQLAESELAVRDSHVAATTQLLEKLVQEKMLVARRVSECSEDVNRWLNAAAKAEAGDAGISSVEGEGNQGADDCWQRHQEAVDTLKVLRSRVEELDSSLQDLSKVFLASKEEANNQSLRVQEMRMRADEAKQRRTAVLCEWTTVVDAGNTCNAELRSFAARLDDARSTLESERRQRSTLRGTIQSVITSLVALDDHLESLEAKDAYGAAATQLQELSNCAVGVRRTVAPTQSFET